MGITLISDSDSELSGLSGVDFECEHIDFKEICLWY